MNFGTERNWKKKILEIKKEVGEAKYPFPGFIKNMILRDHLYLLLEDKLIQFCEKKKVGILFSGGVDSAVLSMLCQKLKFNYCCYSVGFQDNETKYPEDIEYSKIIAHKYNLNLKFKVFNLKEIEVVIKKTLKILSKNKDTTDVVNLGVGAVELAAIEMAKKDKCDIVLSGLGSEEIFAGYQAEF
jgi:asparagine synthase (glutamine-hydrolysing)